MGMDNRRALHNTFFNIRSVVVTDDEVIFELADASEYCIGKLEDKCSFELLDAEKESIEEGNLIGGNIVGNTVHVKRENRRKEVASILVCVRNNGPRVWKEVDL